MNEKLEPTPQLDERIDAVIYTWRDKCLKAKAEWVEEFNNDLVFLANKMVRVMRQANGVGLAANQIGHSENMFVCVGLNSSEPIVAVNPEIVGAGVKKKAPEGCLSIPTLRFDVPRFERVYMVAQDLTGYEYEMEADGFQAQILQHEFDHLNGTMCIDRLSSTESKRAYRWLKKELYDE